MQSSLHPPNMKLKMVWNVFCTDLWWDLDSCVPDWASCVTINKYSRFVCMCDLPPLWGSSAPLTCPAPRTRPVITKLYVAPFMLRLRSSGCSYTKSRARRRWVALLWHRWTCRARRGMMSTQGLRPSDLEWLLCSRVPSFTGDQKAISCRISQNVGTQIWSWGWKSFALSLKHLWWCPPQIWEQCSRSTV